MEVEKKKKESCAYIAQNFPVLVHEKTFSVEGMLRSAVGGRIAPLDDYDVIHDVHDLTASSSSTTVCFKDTSPSLSLSESEDEESETSSLACSLAL